MSSSLLIAGFDVLNPASAVQLKPDGWDRGAPSPSVAEIQSTVLDGAVVSGLASGNRQPQFTLLVRAANRLALAATTNQILQYVDQQAWTMTFTPDGGLPVIYDCYRATSSISSTLLEDLQLTQEISIKCEALPYGRSPTLQSFALIASPPVVVDDYTTLPTITPTTPNNWSTASSVSTYAYFTGTTSLEINPSVISQHNVPAVTVARTGLSISLASGAQYATLAVLFQSLSTITTAWSLTVTVGGVNYTATSSDPVGPSIWATIKFTFPTTIPAGTLTAYSLTIPPWTDKSGVDQMYIDDLSTMLASATRSLSSLGDEFILPSILGSARTPVNLQLTAPSGTFGQFCVHAPPFDTPQSQCLLTINSSGSPWTVTTPPAARYKGTYSVWISVAPGTGLTTGSTITCNILQNTSVPNPQVNLTHVVTAAEQALGGQSMLLYFGEVTLPLLDVPPQVSGTVTFSVAGISSGDRVGDILLLDTRGQTIITDVATTTSAKAVFIDEPSPGSAFGPVYLATLSTNLSDAYSVLPDILTGAPIWLYPPGNSRLLIWNVKAATTNTVTYYPRWLQEATA